MNKTELLRSRLKQHSSNTADAAAFIASLVDEKSFVEINDCLTLSEACDEKTDALLTGYASIGGRAVALAVQNSSVNYGGMTKVAADKLCKIMESAASREVPFILAADSFGADVSEGALVLKNFARILRCAEEMKKEVPFIVIARGNCVGNAALLEAMAHISIAVSGCVISLNSPSVVLATEGKSLDAEKDFGARASVSGGRATLYAEKETVGEVLAKILSFVPECFCTGTADEDTGDVAFYNRKARGIGEKRGKELILELCDEGSFVELHEGFAPHIVTGFARVLGIPVAFASGDGSAVCPLCVNKVRRLVSLASAFGMPFVNLVDCEGVMISGEIERSAMGRELAGLQSDLAGTYSGKMAIITGKAIGTGYTAMASAYAYDSVMAWNDAQISPLTANAGGIVMYSDRIKSKDVLKSREEAAKLYAEVDGDALTAAACGLAEKIFAPEDTRRYLLSRLQIVRK